MAGDTDRAAVLAFVAEKYYLEDYNQSEIAEMVGRTRSAISRMLTEAREKGIVEIIVHHPFRYDQGLEEALKQRLNLEHVRVVEFINQHTYLEIRKQLGKAASRLLAQLIKPGHTIGIAWGTTIQAAIESYDAAPTPDTKVVQLVGVLGSTRQSYSAQTLVETMAEKINGEGFYLYAPFLVENESTAAILRDDPNVRESIALSRECDLALLGIGTTQPDFCSLYQEKHISLDEVEKLQEVGAVGDVCANYYQMDGSLAPVDFHQRRIGVSPEDLAQIQTKLGVAGHPQKAEAVLGAIRGGFVNALVTDNLTAIRVLELEQGA